MKRGKPCKQRRLTSFLECGRSSSHPPARTLWQVCLSTGLILIVVTVLLTQTALASRILSAAALALLPFLGCGLFLALVFTAKAMYSRELYAADLFGAGMGCLVSLLVLQGLGVENTLALSALGLLGVAVFLAFTTDRRRWLIPVCISLCVGSLLGFKMMFGSLTIRPAAVMHSDKYLRHILRQAPHARIVDSRWSALSRYRLRIADGRPHGSTGLWVRRVVGVLLTSKGGHSSCHCP